MKVVCESCQAKYQVPDERVAGKKLKIRCKRCGATVLIRGDLTQSQSVATVDAPSDMSLAGAPDSEQAPVEWHVSVDGDTRGPFDIEELRIWLSQTPSAWDAHVWREGFPDWIEARLCAELGPPPSAYSDQGQEDEAPTQTFENAHAGAFMAQAARHAAAHGAEAGAMGSSIRSRTASGIAASPRVSAGEALTGERHEDSVLFSARGLQNMSSTPSYNPGPNPGFAGGDGSGLIDIRALASLARQNQPHIARNGSASQSGGYAAPDNGFSYGSESAEEEDARVALMNQSSAFGRVDSLAPVSTTTKTSNVAVPLAILGGCALVAAAVFAAILIARPNKSAEPVAVSAPATPAEDSVAATAQPVQGPEAKEEQAAPEVAQPSASDTTANSEGSGEVAAGKTRRQPRGSRTASDEKKSSAPEEKAKPKKEEKSEPPSLDEVMLADKAKPQKEKEKEKEPVAEAPKEAKADKAEKEAPKGGTSIDDLLGGPAKPAKQAAKPNSSRSIDDLLSGAVDKNGKAPAPAPAPAAEAPAASDLPDTPSRDETLAAMRSVEPAVRACASGQTVTGTAEVQINVSGSTGRVTTANVVGITGGVGSCIARAVRNAKFPRFSKPSFAIKYPYRF